MVFYMTTGQIIKQLREQKGMTQEKLAELMGYSHKSSINKIEMGKADLPQSKLVEFAKIFGVSPCDLLGYEPASDEQMQVWNELYNSKNELQKASLLLKCVQDLYGKDAVKMLELFNELNKKKKKKAIDSLNDLTEISKYTEQKGE